MAEIYEIDPTKDPRWSALVLRHPRSSVFHSPEWLGALRRTYGFRPVAFSTDSVGKELQNGLVLCQVDSWLTGNRFVSLPFSDHCDPLCDDSATFDSILSAAVARLLKGNCRYVELRPVQAVILNSSFANSTVSHYLHRLDLRPNLTTLFNNCHKECTQRKVRRAQREGLVYEEGRCDRILNAFYGLLVMTRRRHRLPPQPLKWFVHLIEGFGESLKIRLALKSGLPVAAILTLRHKDTLVYKYGCSDPRFHNLGSMQFLLWHAIEEAKHQGLQSVDLGRSDTDTPGLIKFKDRLGAARSTLVYTRIQAPDRALSQHAVGGPDWKHRIARGIISHMPDRALRSAGRIFYKHIG